MGKWTPKNLEKRIKKVSSRKVQILVKAGTRNKVEVRSTAAFNYLFVNGSLISGCSTEISWRDLLGNYIKNLVINSTY